MSKEDQECIDFATKWLPFGGGDEYILPEFGIAPYTFYLRLNALLHSPAVIGLGLSTKLELSQACRAKLSQRSRRIHELA